MICQTLVFPTHTVHLEAYQPLLQKIETAMSWYERRSATAKNMARSVKAELGFGRKAPGAKKKAKPKGKAKSKGKVKKNAKASK